MKPRFTLPQNNAKPSSGSIIGGHNVNKQKTARTNTTNANKTVTPQPPTPQPNTPVATPETIAPAPPRKPRRPVQSIKTTSNRSVQAEASKAASRIDQPFRQSYSNRSSSSALSKLQEKKNRLFSRSSVDNIETNEDRQKKLERAQKMSSFKGVISLVQFIVGAIALALFITNFVFQSFQVVGSSMQPTLQQDDWLIISKVGKSWSRLTGSDFIPDRGEIVVFNDPRTNAGKSLIKRVIGLPGETVKIEEGKLVVYNNDNPDGFSPDDAIDTLTRFITEQDEVPKEGIIVPEGEIFVAGDNRVPGASLDSRTGLGTVPSDKIVGILSIRLYPLSEAKKF